MRRKTKQSNDKVSHFHLSEDYAREPRLVNRLSEASLGENAKQVMCGQTRPHRDRAINECHCMVGNLNKFFTPMIFVHPPGITMVTNNRIGLIVHEQFVVLQSI